jgi:uncharacterized membrane protein
MLEYLLGSIRFHTSSSIGLAPIFVSLAVLICISIILRIRYRARIPLLILRSLQIEILAICLIMPSISLDSPYKTKIAVLVDISDSIPGKVGESSLNLASNISRNIAYDVLPFSSKLSPLNTSENSYSKLRASWSKALDSSTTDILGPISKAQSLAYDGILLISDGHANVPSEPSLTFNKPVFPILLEDSGAFTATFEITSLNLPVEVAPETRVLITASVTNKTANHQEDTLKFLLNDKEVCSEKVHAEAGAEVVVKCSLTSTPNGPMKITSLLSRTEVGTTGFISIKSKNRALILSGSQKDERYLKTLLERLNIECESIIASDNMTLLQWNKHSLVILNNVSSTQLGTQNINSLQSEVKNGLGLFTIGGERAFGLGDYHKTKLQEIIPVDSLPPQTETKRLSNAIVLVIDKSGSMEQASKLEYAKAAAIEVIKRLNDDDYVSVIGFDNKDFILIKMDRVSVVRTSAMERIRMLYAASSSNLIPGLNAAQRQLESVKAGRKHIIIVSDGEVRGSIDYYSQFTSLMTSIGITASTVYVGFENPIIMQHIAESGGGRFYSTSDASSIPRIFLKDLEVAVGERTMNENNYSVRTMPQALLVKKGAIVPNIRGYIKTKIKTDAQLDLVTGSLEESPPLLAHFSVGKGKSVALTTDLNGTWSNALIGWNGLPILLKDIFQYTRSENSKLKPLDFDFRHFVQDGHIVLDFTIFERLEGSGLDISVSSPSGKEIKPALEKLEEGHYQAKIATKEAGAFDIRVSHPLRSVPPLKIFLNNSPQNEKLSTEYNSELLGRIATASGGKINPTAKDFENLKKAALTSKLDIRPYLFGLFVFLLVLETFIRERR